MVALAGYADAFELIQQGHFEGVSSRTMRASSGAEHRLPNWKREALLGAIPDCSSLGFRQ
jgi:hypothetical protein